MAGFCLNPKVADDLKAKFVSGEINPEALAGMSSKDRRAFLTEHVGESNAEPVNRLFESKLILKNQQQGMINWAKKLIGVTPEVRRDLIARIERMDKILEPHDEQAFLEDLASYRLGTRVSYEEAQRISELADKVEETQNSKDEGGDRLEYGRAVVALNNYVKDLKLTNAKSTLRGIQGDFQDTTALQKVGKTAALGLRAASHIPGFLKSVKSSFDNSALFLQGFKTLVTHPGVWQRNARKSFIDLWNTFGGQNVLDELQADILSRPSYDKMRKAKLDVGTSEEAFPSNFIEKADTKLAEIAKDKSAATKVALAPLQLVPRAYTASQNAYTSFVHKTRADLFDLMLKLQEKNDYEMPSDELPNLGRMVNSMVGRGYLGRLERGADTLNVAMFSPRNLKAHIDTLLQPFTGGASMMEIVQGENSGSDFVRKEATKNLLKMIGTLAMVMLIVKQFCDECIETDSRSANFGTIKFRNTRYDLTGGQKSLWVLASRMLTGASKSSITDEVRPINELDKSGKPKFGATTRVDLLEDFFENKMSPAGGLLKDLALERDFKGNPVSITKPSTYGQVVWNSTVPFPVDNAKELLSDPNAAPLLVSLMASSLGVNTSTYGGVKDIKKQILDAEKRGDAKEVERLKVALSQTIKLEEEAAKKRKEALGKK